MNSSTRDFIIEIRELLNENRSTPQNKEEEYLDLGGISECSPDQLQRARTVLPGESPVYMVFTRIIHALGKNEVAHAKLGINELLQYYLLQTEDSPSGQESHIFLDYLFLIVQFFTQDAFPYDRYFFDYLMRCYHPICNFLLLGHKTEEIERFMEHIISVGKIAAQRQMDTCSIHHLLRNIETFAAQEQLKELASKAKDSRHTLEI